MPMRQRGGKRPKFPTRLEESMMKRKHQEFICTCYGDIKPADASIPETTEDEGMLPPLSAGVQPGDSITAVTAEVPSETKTATHGTDTSHKRCMRMHVMYKTPAQVLREMDEERDRMALIAELTDMIEKQTAKMKAAQKKKKKKKKKLKAEKVNKEQPSWYQELSAAQMNSTEMLGSALMADMEEGGMDRTLMLIKSLGLKPLPPCQVVWHVMVNCYTSPVLFLLYLALCLAPRTRPNDKNDEPIYAVRERIVLSSLTHILIPRTLFDLHYLLPPSEKDTLEINHRVPASFRLKKKMVYASPYLEPQPVLVADKMKSIKEQTEKLIDTLETSGQVTIPKNADFNKETHCEQVEHRILYTQKKLDHFHKVREQHRQQAMSSYVQIERNYGVFEEEENSFYRQFSFLPSLDPTFPNETYSFLRYSTSTEPPDTSALAQIQEPRDQTFIPMMSLTHCASSWDHHRLGDIKGTLVPPVSHIFVDENTTPLQIKALEGYFHAYPQIVPVNPPRLKPLTEVNPLTSRDYMDYLKKALIYLAKRGNPLAALPDAHLIPHIQKWILKRYRFKMSTNFKSQLFRKSNNIFLKERYKTKLTPKPRKYLCKLLGGITWDRRVYLQKLIREVKSTFYGQIQTTMVNSARDFWPVMCMKYYDDHKFRDAYYSYLPCKQRDILLH